MEINTGIAIPFNPKESKYPWRYLEVGHSFLFPETTKEDSARKMAHLAARRCGFKFSVRKTREGLRCWRVA